MTNGKYNRGLLILLILSLGLNAFFIAFAVSAMTAISDPDAAVRAQIQKRLDRLPEPYREQASKKLSDFYEKNLPAIKAYREERKSFVTLLMGKFDEKQALDKAAAIRAMNQKNQEAGQVALIDMFKDVPAGEKAKMIDGDRLMHALMKDDSK